MSTTREKLVAAARSQLGCRYWSMHYGPKGSSEEGFGCAMLVRYIFKTVMGFDTVGSCYNFAGDCLGQSVNQGGKFRFISASEALPGDAVLYGAAGYDGTDYDDYGHIALYIGNGKVIGAMGSGKPGQPGYLNIGVSETTVSKQNIGGVTRYIRCKQLDGDTPSPTPTPTEVSPVNKTVTVRSATLNVRDKPSTKTGAIKAQYKKGETVVIDGVAFGDDGYMWGHYIGASSGKDRYIALGSMELAR